MIVAVEAPHPDAQTNLPPEEREIRRLPDIGAVHAAADVPACRAVAMGGATLDCNNEGVLADRSEVADPAAGNERERGHAPLCRWNSAGSGHVTATHPRKVRESHQTGSTSPVT